MPETAYFYDPAYNYGRGLPLKRVHGFVLDKARRVRDALVGVHGVAKSVFVSPAEPTPEELQAVHAPSHLDGLRSSKALAKAAELSVLAALPGPLARRAILTPQLRATGGTIAALRHAAAGGWAFNLAGGYHHARPALAHGFCLIADVAVALAAVDVSGPVVVIDLDTHHGDGNAVALRGAANVLTASLHERDAFPFPKPPSDIDHELPSGVDDAAYLEAVDRLVAEISERVTPTVIVYVAGTDILAGDPLGSQRVTAAGVLERDRRIGRWARELRAGLVLLPAGGYSEASPGVVAAGIAALADMARAS